MSDFRSRQLKKNEKQTRRRERRSGRPFGEGKKEDSMPERLRRIAAEQKAVSDWLPLDNAALIFPASENADMSSMFRVGALLNEPIDPVELQYAVNEVVPRFPGLCATLKGGFFRYYLEPSATPLVVQEESEFPMRPIPLDTRHHMVRVLYYGNAVDAEFFHVATDGNGGIVFLNTLIACYLRRKGVFVGEGANCLDTRDRPRPEELSDSYKKVYDGKTKKDKRETKAYHMHGKKLPATMLAVIQGVLNADELNAAAKSRNLTVGELLTAVLAYAVDAERAFYMRGKNHPIVVNIPVNLRKVFPSETLRNFVAIMPVRVECGSDFETIEKTVREQFAHMRSEQYLRGYVNYNVNVEKNKLFVALPLPLKNVGMKAVLKLYSDRVTTTTFSNLGRIAAPKEFEGHVLRYDFYLGPNRCQLTNLCAAAYNNNVVLSFSRYRQETGVEKYFFRKLSELGVSVTLESNCEL